MSENENVNEAKLLWDEYQYRHEHCWTTIFRLTSAAVLLGAVPYVAPAELRTSHSLLAPPIVAVLLIVVAMLRMHSELELLRQIRKQHRTRQESHYHFVFTERKWRGSFDQHVWFYLAVFLVLAAANVAFVAFRP